MSKVVLKTAIKTAIAVIVLLLVAFAVASLGFPKKMAEFNEKCGNYSIAAGYMSLSYTYSGEVDDIARCVADSVLAENDKNTVKFGDKLLSHEKFDEYCEGQTEKLNIDYRQYICGQISAAKYREGDTDGAVEAAKRSLEKVKGFPAGNPLVRLTVEMKYKNDRDGAKKILAALEGITPAEDELTYYERVKIILENI